MDTTYELPRASSGHTAPAPPGDLRPCNDAMDFFMAFMGGVNQGTRFRLADGSILPSSIPETGGPVPAGTVRDAMEIVSRYFHPPTLGDGMSEVRVQQFVLLFAEIIRFMTTTAPGVSPATMAYELGNAVAAMQDALRTKHPAEPV